MANELDKYEQEIADNIENAESIMTDSLKDDVMQAAKNTYAVNKNKKDKTMTIRISQYDLDNIKARAEKAGLPYQTVAGALLHQYGEGDLDVRL
jgi:predicted DNA binding CopG/RHH family protein